MAKSRKSEPKPEDESSVLDKVYASLLTGAQEKFGKAGVYVASDHTSYITGVPCPMAWGWFIGGSNVVPLSRIIGCDGRSGAGKSALMMEHCRWWLLNGGIVVLIDTEEKVSGTLLRSFVWDLPVAVRRYFICQPANSVEEAEEIITYYRNKSKELLDLPPDQRVPLLVLWDSLTGKSTEAQQEKLAKEGSAAAKEYPQETASIARFYKNLVFDGRLLTVAHVQHAKKNIDPDAVGDDEWKTAGGDQPRFSSTYHFRTLTTKDIECEEWAGKQLSLKCIKSGLGDNHRWLKVRFLWNFVPVECPQFGADGELVLTDGQLTKAQAITLFNGAQQALSPHECDVLLAALKLTQVDLALPAEDVAKLPTGPHCVAPLVKTIQFQHTWFDWSWSLGNLLYEMKYEDKHLYRAQKLVLDETLHFVGVDGGKRIKCEALWGDDEPRSVSDFGRAVEAHPEIGDAVRRFLRITSYKSFRE